MAVTGDTLELLDGLSIHIDTALEHVDRALLASWARAWSEVAAEWETALADLAASSQDGAWPSASKVRRAKKARAAMEVTLATLQRAVTDMGLTVSRSLSSLVPDAVDWELQLMDSQLPADTPRGAQLVAGFDRVDPRALDAIVTRTMAGVTADAAVLPGYVTTTIQSVLVKGVAVGDNPRAAAAEMLRRLRGVHDLSRTRALVIARTEMLDAHRAAAQAADRANRSVLTRWEWCTALDARTCIACLAMHGREFPLAEPGPLGHQQCRCARLPVTKSWADLGFEGIEEPESLLPDARAWFDTQPPAVQKQIAGPARLAAYNDGRIAWDDLVVRRTNPGWRDSFVPVPVRALAR